MTTETASILYDIDNLEKVINAVTTKFNITRENIQSKSRKREFVLPRQFIMFYSYFFIEVSITYVANNKVKRNHATVIHGAWAIADLTDCNKRILSEVMELGITVFGEEKFKSMWVDFLKRKDTLKR
jgi:chromosomal replication initiation ATPase DnaA